MDADQLSLTAVLPTSARHHLFIAGTGRAGTSFLVRFLAGMGMQTHLQTRDSADRHDEANAGLEDMPWGPQAGDLPYVIKLPWMCEFIRDILARPDLRIDAVVIPVRDLTEAATSRVVTELRAMHAGAGWLEDLSRSSETWGAAPGGVVFSLNPIDQARLLAVWFHQLVQQLVQADIPVIFLDFPRFATDADYLFDRLHDVLPPGTTARQVREVHGRLADPAKIRVGAELRAAGAAVPMATGPTYPDPETLDAIAMRRELARMRGQLDAVRAAHEAALAEADMLRNSVEDRAAEAEHARQARVDACAEAERRLQEASRTEAGLRSDLAALRASRSWRMTAGLRCLGGAVRRIAARRRSET